MKRFGPENKHRDEDDNPRPSKISKQAEFEIQRYIEIPEEHIHLLFDNMQLNNINDAPCENKHNKALWQELIQTYFSYLIEHCSEQFENNPYELFALEYCGYRDIALQLELSEETFHLLLPALKGDIEKIAQADISKQHKDLFYILGEINGHHHAFEQLDLEGIKLALNFSANYPDYLNTQSLLNKIPPLPAHCLKDIYELSCHKGHIATCELLYEKLGDEFLECLLYCYLKTGLSKAVNDLFLEKNFDKKTIDSYINKVFKLACRFQDAKLVKNLFEKLENSAQMFKNACDYLGGTHFKTLKYFFHHCKLNLTGSDIASYIELCAEYGTDEDIQILLDNYTDIPLFNKTRALCFAARVNNIPVVKLLLTHEACHDIQEGAKGTALLRAIEYGNLKLISILLDYFDDMYGNMFAQDLIVLLTEGLLNNYNQETYTYHIQKMPYRNHKNILSILENLMSSKIMIYKNGFSFEIDESGIIKENIIIMLQKYTSSPSLIFNTIYELPEREENIEMVVESNPVAPPYTFSIKK